MSDFSELIKRQPDLYTRNSFVSKIISDLAGTRKKIKILDVGGRGGKLYEFISDNFTVQILDSLPNDYNEPNYIVGDALNLPFEDNSFDFVVSLETLEHIPKKDKTKFVSELLRVSRLGIVLTAPFFSKEVNQAEKYLNDLYFQNLGRMHPWLKEHFESTLPLEKDIENFFKAKKVHFKKFSQNNLNNWILFMGVNFIEDLYGKLSSEINDYYEFYNRNMMKLGDSFEPSYRKIYFATKDKQIFKKLKKENFTSTKNTLLYEKFIYDSIFLLSKRIQQKEFDYSQLQRNYEQLTRENQGLIQSLKTYRGSLVYKILRSLSFAKKLIKFSLKIEKLSKGISFLIKYGPIGLLRKIIYSETVDVEYKNWLLKNSITPEKMIQMRIEQERFKLKPKISVLMPVYNTPINFLRQAIDSVINQVYENWEFCIVDDASTNSEIHDLLKDYQKKDSRIRLQFRKENGGISAASNTALKMVKGEFIAVLDHDDLYWPNAFFETVKIINKYPKADFIYSDEDKIDENNNHSGPFFKPDYSPDLLLSEMYMTHFTALRKTLADRVGVFNEKYPGSQDWDYVLRVVEASKEIYHIPKILYSFRMWVGSTAGNPKSKSYAYKAHQSLLEEVLSRRKTPGLVKPGPFLGSYNIFYSVEREPLVSVIISTKDKAGMLKKCIDGVLTNTYQNFEILLINNQSSEKETYDYFDKIKNNPKIKILDYDKPFHISKIFNFAVSKAEGELILLLGNDIEPIKNDWLAVMVGFAQRSDVGGVGVKLLFPDKKIQHCGVILGLGPHRVAGHPYYKFPDEIGYAGLINVTRNYSAVTGACFMTKKKIYEKVGGFDESLRVLFNDVDYCLKVRGEGYQIIYTPQAALYHHESASLGKIETRGVDMTEVNYMKSKWGDLLENDPFYNKNLSLDYEDFRIKTD